MLGLGISLDIKKRVPLAPYTTFFIGGEADFFVTVSNLHELQAAVSFAKRRSLPVMPLGGGSNILVSDSGFRGLVVKLELKGRRVIAASGQEVSWEVAAGENWDGVVADAVGEGLWGIENLSHIPGCVGAFAVQNVGAYGQEAAQVVRSVRAIDLRSGQEKLFSNQDCFFAYRKSVFNSKHRGHYCIVSTAIALSVPPRPNLSYRDLADNFSDTAPKLEDIRKAIIKIRDDKFPFPDSPTKGNAGSFFKNIYATAGDFSQAQLAIGKAFGEKAAAALKDKTRPDGDGYKVSAAALIDLCGLKGLRQGGASINPTQPLVLLNSDGKTTAADILGLAGQVTREVRKASGLTLQVEPELIGFSTEEILRYGIIK